MMRSRVARMGLHGWSRCRLDAVERILQVRHGSSRCLPWHPSASGCVCNRSLNPSRLPSRTFLVLYTMITLSAIRFPSQAVVLFRRHLWTLSASWRVPCGRRPGDPSRCTCWGVPHEGSCAALVRCLAGRKQPFLNLRRLAFSHLAALVC